MKKLIVIISLFFSVSAFSQQFDGVNISGDLPTAISSLKAKGYTLSKPITNGVIMNGKIGSTEIELFLFTTPKSKKVYKAAIYLPIKENWYSIKQNYLDYLEVLTNKYGTPDNSFNFFSKPYFEGDGYEMLALDLEKCTYSAYWLKLENTSIYIEISKYKQVKISYENNENQKIAAAEKAAQNNASF
ncbi:MAG: hypothetical protein ACOVNU_11680 [Candidatus Kapaibacteriota bacterium]